MLRPMAQRWHKRLAPSLQVWQYQPTRTGYTLTTNQQVGCSSHPGRASFSPYELKIPFNWILSVSIKFVLIVDNVMDNGISRLSARGARA